VAVLVERLDLHGIGEIALPANPPPAQLFELLQALADQPGAHDVTSRLAAAGADRIRIAPVGQPPSAATPRGPVASSEDFGAREPVIPNPDTPVDRKSGALGTAGILRGESMRDIKSVPLEGVPLVTHDPPPPKAADALPGVVDRASPRRESGADGLLSLSSEREAKPAPPRAAPPPPPAAPPPAPPPSAAPPPARPSPRRQAPGPSRSRFPGDSHRTRGAATRCGRRARRPRAQQHVTDRGRPPGGADRSRRVGCQAGALRASAWRDLRYHARGGEGFGGERRAAAVYDRASAHLHQAGSRGPLPTACGAQAPGRRG